MRVRTAALPTRERERDGDVTMKRTLPFRW